MKIHFQKYHKNIIYENTLSKVVIKIIVVYTIIEVHRHEPSMDK